MNIFQWFKIKKLYNAKIKQLSNKSFESLIESTIKLYPKVIDISDGELRDGNGFWSENLSDAWDNAENQNTARSEEIDFMIWAVYIVLGKKCRESFKKGNMTVRLSELSFDKIRKQYVKAILEADIY